MLTLTNDPRQPGGGYAILEGPGLDGLSALCVEDGFSGLYLGADGRWAKTPTLLPVSAAPSRPGALVLGPHIVDCVPTDSLVAFRGPDGDLLGKLFWNGINPSRNRGIVAPTPIQTPRPLTDTPIPGPTTVTKEPERAGDVPPLDVREGQNEERRKDGIPADKEQASRRVVAARPPARAALPPVVWATCYHVLQTQRSLMVPCVAPALVALLLLIWGASWMTIPQVEAWIVPLLAAIYLIAKLCQRTVVQSTYALHEVRQDGEHLVPRNLSVELACMTAVSLPTLVLSSVGLGLFVVPGLLVAAIFLSATPACLIERRGPLRALGRGLKLLRGHVFATLVAVLAPAALMLSLWLVLVVLASLGRKDLLYCTLCLIPAGFPLSALLSTVLFAELRRRQELSRDTGTDVALAGLAREPAP